VQLGEYLPAHSKYGENQVCGQYFNLIQWVAVAMWPFVMNIATACYCLD